MTSYMGKFLIIDLSRQEASAAVLNPGIQKLLIGGKGVGAKILYDLVPEGCDPLGDENVLVFMTGPLTGTQAPAMRGCVIAKSPLTGTFADSYYGGHFSPEIKYAGYDGIVIRGRASSPVYVWIDDDKVEFRSASHLWGKDTFATNWLIKNELVDKSIKVACIGPGGENLVRFALVSCEYNRQAGRGGMGAVMGSKNLKAIAVRGNHIVRVKDSDTFRKAVHKAYSEMNENTTGAFTLEGTAGSIPFANEIGLLPSRNYYDGTFDKAESIGPEAQRKKLWYRDLACAGCPIRCSKMGKIRSGKFAGTISDAVEYELLGLLGSNLEISDIRAITHLASRCDALGLDGMSAGGVIGFAMEAFEKGLIRPSDADGKELRFGSVEAADYLIDAIAFRKGELGRTLGEGVRQAAGKFGGEAEGFAVHIKGLEYPAWGPRGVPGMALALATADRGGCHQRGFPILAEIEGEWNGKTIEQLGLKHKGEMVAHMQNYLAALDTLVKCDFAQYGIQEDTYREMLAAATGTEFSFEELLALGDRIWNMVKCFNVREGFERKDDTLPRRFMEEPLPSGPCKGHRITGEDLKTLLDDYYRARGWDSDGKPLPETLERLDLVEERVLFKE
ncbi:aldehyde ferredoxin oxidoreductase family protein [Desulfococcaceae bacterium HSG8]|nr:aldehyde ferredoxin oxidoreductase family protein [Desulfococcaceae bacterium HSG8]